MNFSELLKQLQRKLKRWICRDDNAGNGSIYSGIMQGLSFSLCLYSAYSQGTWPSWLHLETTAIQITNKNNGIKSEYMIWATMPQGISNPPAAWGEGREKEIFPIGRSSHSCCLWGFLDPSLKCLVLYSLLGETGCWTRWTNNLIHHGNPYDPTEMLWIIQICCKKNPPHFMQGNWCLHDKRSHNLFITVSSSSQFRCVFDSSWVLPCTGC